MKQFTKKDTPEVKIISFSGQEGATGNMTLYECEDDLIAVDCGISFPDDTLPGIDLVIPDFTYVLENIHKFRGVVVSHAHEDHLGAIPFLLREVNVPIYASKVVQEFLKERIRDKASEDILNQTSMHLLDETVTPIKLGNFTIEAFNVNHSVPNSLGIVINTPQGRILHMADYKVDFQPVLDKPIDLEALTRYGKEGVLCLLSDCLGADTKGGSEPESSMNETFINLFHGAEGRQIMVTQISSNIARIYQIVKAAQKVNRKVVLGGRSIEKASEIGRNLGYLDFPEEVFVTERQAQDYYEDELVYIVAGCFGQMGSTADRISRGEHKYIQLEENCRFIVSAEPGPPGSRVPMESMRDRLVLAGAEVIYPKIYDHLHISGHGHRTDLETVAAAVKPKYFIPIGGSPSHMRAYTNMVSDMGFARDSVFELLEGENVIFTEKGAKMGKRLAAKQVFVDGKRIGEVGAIVIKDRETLSSDGVFVVVIPISKTDKTALAGAEVITRGFIYVKESKALMGQAKDIANKILDKHKGDLSNWTEVQKKIEKEIEKFLFKETGSRPLTIVHSIYV